MLCIRAAVRSLGQRFINEDVYPGVYNHAALLHEPAPRWVVIDEEGIEAGAAAEAPGPRPRHVAESAAELGAYAAGRASSGIHGEGYLSGTSLGDGTFFGRRAGRAAAR